MPELNFDEAYGGNAAENYQRHFVPAIGAPLANDLVQVADIRPGERILDVACGTGVVTRLAAELAGASGHVAGLDLNPGMLAVARSATRSDTPIQWHEASAEKMPLPDASFDVVLCQMGLQFIPDKSGALNEMHRLLNPDGRLVVSLPGPTPPLMAILGEELARHVAPETEGFVKQIFALHDEAEVQELVEGAGFRAVAVQSETRELPLPPPAEFLWGYVHSTPLAGAVGRLDEEGRRALERDVVERWQNFLQDGSLMMQLRMVVATARK